MDYQNILIGAVAGLVVSQLSFVFNKVYDMVHESEKRRDQLLTEKLEQQEERVSKAITQLKDQADERDEFLRQKSIVLDKKLSLVLSKLVAGTSTGNGMYKTSVGLDGNGLRKLKEMESMIQQGNTAVAAQFQEILHRYGDRVDAGDDEKERGEAQRLREIAELELAAEE